MNHGTMLFHVLSLKKNSVNSLIVNYTVFLREDHLLYGLKREFIFLYNMMVWSGLKVYPVIQMENQHVILEDSVHNRHSTP